MKDFFAVSSVRNYSVAADKPSLDGNSSNYVEEMYNSWLRDPASVHTVSSINSNAGRKRSPEWFTFTIYILQSWDAYFRSNTYCAPPSFAPQQKNQMPLSQLAPLIGGGALAGAEPDEKIIDDHLAVQAIIRSYQVM